jgi:Flp pilus assembly protein TadG
MHSDPFGIVQRAAMKNQRYCEKNKLERGQSFVELAISLVFLLVLLSTVLDLGWALFTFMAIRDSAQEASSFASICQDPVSIEKRLKDSATAPINLRDIQSFQIQYFDGSGNTIANYRNVDGGDSVKVTLTVNHQILTPFVGAFIGNKNMYPLKADATNKILRVRSTTNCQ